MLPLIKSLLINLLVRLARLIYGLFGFAASVYFRLRSIARLDDDGRSRRAFRQRQGYLPPVPGRGIWIHGASLGEINAISALIEELRRRYPGRQLIISLTNESDLDSVSRQFSADTVVLFPIDLGPYVARALDRIHPAMVVFTEAEVWPIFLSACLKRSIPAHLVNARVSSRTAFLYGLFPRVFRQRFYSGFRSIQVRDAVDLERYLQMGIGEDIVSVAGYLRWNFEPPQHFLSDGRGLAQKIRRPIWIAASIHRNDIRRVLSIHQYLRLHLRDVLLLLMPRYPGQDKPAIERELRTRGLSYQTVDEKSPVDSGEYQLPDPDCSVLWIQRTGDLIRWYACANLALIGGSFDGIGGHNPIEAALSDCAIFSGTSVENFTHIYRQLAEYEACVMHNDPVALGELMLKTFSNEDGRRALCANALACIRSQRLELGAVVDKLAQSSEMAPADDGAADKPGQ